VKGLRKNLKSDETVDLVDNFQPENTDFKTTITKLKKRNYDAIGIFLAENQISLFYNQAHSLDFSAPTFGSHSLGSKDAITQSRGNMSSAVYPAIPVNPSFRGKYVSKFGNDIQISFAGNAYDFAIMIGELFNKTSGKLSPTEIVSRIKSVEDREGVSGTYKNVESSNVGNGFNFSILLKEIQKDGSMKTIKP